MARLSPLYPHEFLAEMLVPGYENVYVLGCFARYATIYSQQIRAINLADALCRTGRLTKGTKVAIVGASTAGLTAALATGARGAAVRVFEKERQLFPIQRNPGNRYLHPHVYDWPLGDLLDGKADLPILDWKADPAYLVVAALEEGWNKGSAQLKLEPVETGSELTGLQMNGSRPVLNFQTKQHEMDIAILAIGFGAEVDRPDLQRYWQPDPIDSTLKEGSKVLVSGAGDGALTDVMRLCIQDFKHDKIVRMLGDERLVSALKGLLSNPDGKRTEDIFREVTKATQFKLGPPEVTFRSGIEVILNAPDGYLESVQTAILNRFIAYLLEGERKFRRVPGMLGYPIPRPNERSRYEVMLGSEKQVVDRLLVRHGPERDADDGGMPGHWHNLVPIWKACQPLAQRWSANAQGQDRTLIPLYTPGDYDLSSPRPVERPPAVPRAAGLTCFVVESSVADSSLRKLVSKSLTAHCNALGNALGRSERDPLRREDIQTQSSSINELLRDGSSFGKAIGQLSAADVVIFDVTGYEPGVLLLVGIRSVLRQGVTLITTAEKFDAQRWSSLPFNIKELYPLAVTKDQTTTDDLSHPFQLLGRTIAKALDELRRLPQYQDSPAHEDVRRLGPSATDFGRIEANEGILWLCPLAGDYYDELGQYVAQTVKDYFGLTTPFQRITDIVSPQLVSQRLYSAIRRRDLCVVDWTTWSPNVFYELGVRLAVNRFSTVCILAGGAAAPKVLAGVVTALKDSELEQRRRLVKLFAPVEYDATATSLAEIQQRHKQIIESAGRPTPAWGDIPFDYVYRLIADLSDASLMPEQEVAQMLQTLASVRLGTGGTSNWSSPVLYADLSPAIAGHATAGAAELLLAAWFYLGERHGLKEIRKEKLGDESYQSQLKAYLLLAERVIALLKKSTSAEDRALSTNIENGVDNLREAMKGER